MSLAVQAHEKLLAEGKRSRVVSILSREMFEHQTQAYQDTVLPPNVYARVAVEQASGFGWDVMQVNQVGSIAPRRLGLQRRSRSCKEDLGSNLIR